MPGPRLSTDEETAPLLDDSNGSASSHSLFRPGRPLTSLEKALAGVGILLLLLMSTFVGLFAGAESMLKKERHKSNQVKWKTATTTATATATATTTVLTSPTGKPEPKLCVTTDCVLLSAQILQSLNTSVDPCEDFYEFATGGWDATHEIPASRSIYGTFNEVSDRNKKIIRQVLESIPSTSLDLAATPDEANLNKLKSVYTSCLDIDRLDDIGIKPLISLVDTILDKFAPFDLIPAPDVQAVETEWSGTYDGSYEISPDLIASAKHVQDMKAMKESGSHLAPSEKRACGDLEVETLKFDKERRARITSTLAWLASRGTSCNSALTDSTGVDTLINFVIEGDSGGQDSQIQSLALYQAFGGLPSKEYYDEAPILDLYQSVIANMLVDIASHTKAHAKRDLVEDLTELVQENGWPWPWPGDDDGGKKPDEPTGSESLEKRMEKLAAKVVKFERALMKAGADPEYLFNPHYAYNPYPTTNVSDALPFLDLPAYLSTFAPRAFPKDIVVSYPPYLKSVSKLIAQTPDYVLSGYFVTRLAMSYSGALGASVEVRKEAKRLDEVLRGIKKGAEEDRVDVCLGWVDNIVGHLAGREFVREAFSAGAKTEGEDIIFAKLKAEAIIPKIGYPLYPNTTDPVSLQNYYGRLDIDSKDFFGNVLRATVLDEIRTWSSLGSRRNRNSWEMNAQTVNAYYSPPDGEIVFPAGIMQPPFFSGSWPSYMNYGAFGSVAAHELTHAFDNTGAQYDEQGRLRDWWTNTTIRAFEDRAQCVAKQYSKYYILDGDGKKVHVNGNLTNGENIADSGIAQSFAAWKAKVRSNGIDEHLPGLGYTPEQMFFISFGRAWAQLIKPAAAKVRVLTDPHSPNQFRVKGTLSNSEAFHKAFGCKVGSGMRPPKSEQCELW
ncbi:hypothetical protein P7C73_g3073, partial [Tremellales sp. Uapishka_1]